MLKRLDWYTLFGLFFVVVGVLFLFTGQWVEAAWSLLIGGGNLFVSYAQKHPTFGRGRFWLALAIIYVVILAALTLVKLKIL